jgi:hypothetical protein
MTTSSTKRSAVLVLGIRSGTSCLAHLLNRLGAQLPEQLVEPAHTNLFGFWEATRLMELNEEILRALDRSWYDPRPISRAWFRSKSAYAFQKRIGSVIASDYGDASLILLKDPRICRLAPLYLDALDVLEIEPRILFALRYPVEMIRSIQEVIQSFDERPERSDPRTIELLWLRFILEAEEATRTCRRVWTSFEQLLTNWETTIQSIAQGLELVWPNAVENVAAELPNILRPRHRHYQTTDNFLALGPLTIRAWQAVQHGLNGQEATAQPQFDQIREAMIELDRLSAPSQEYLDARFAQVETERKQLEELLLSSRIAYAEADVRSRQLNNELQDRAIRIAELEKDLSKIEAELSERIKESQQLRGQLNSVQTSICWRLTWPIRWLHKALRAVAKALSGSRRNSLQPSS